jgi:hypothetical protein
MSENKNISATTGVVYWRDPATEPPPRGSKLLILTSGGVAVFGDWMDDSNFVAWSPLPKRRTTPVKMLSDDEISVLWHEAGEQPFKFARMIEKLTKE